MRRLIPSVLVCAALVAVLALNGCRKDDPLIDGRVSATVTVPR